MPTTTRKPATDEMEFRQCDKCAHLSNPKLFCDLCKTAFQMVVADEMKRKHADRCRELDATTRLWNAKFAERLNTQAGTPLSSRLNVELAELTGHMSAIRADLGIPPLT